VNETFISFLSIARQSKENAAFQYSRNTYSVNISSHYGIMVIITLSREIERSIQSLIWVKETRGQMKKSGQTEIFYISLSSENAKEHREAVFR
jgi:hypothetical protein